MRHNQAHLRTVQGHILRAGPSGAFHLQAMRGIVSKRVVANVDPAEARSFEEQIWNPSRRAFWRGW